jgi:hypothetical protein
LSFFGYLFHMKRKYIITESQFKMLSEDFDNFARGILGLIAIVIPIGGLWALAELLKQIGRRAEAGGHRARISVRNEKETLLSAYNLAGGKIATKIPQLEKLKIKFDTFCPNQAAQVGTTNIEIESATYIIDAEPKNHLSSKMLISGMDIDTGEKRVLILTSSGWDTVFVSYDETAPSRFGCPRPMVNLSNKNFYRHIVNDLKLVIVDFPITYTSKVETDF